MTEHTLKQQQSQITNKDAIFYKNELFTYYKSGLTRHVFVNKDKTKVIKSLISDKTFAKDYNKEEQQIYIDADIETKLLMAETTLSLEGFIEQEFCTPLKESDNVLTLKQILFASSCRNEVGWTKDNRLVCFDLDEFKKY
jgi:hypothetical protein